MGPARDAYQHGRRRRPPLALDVAPHAGIGNAFFPGLEWTDNAAAHEDATRLADRVVRSSTRISPSRPPRRAIEAALVQWCSACVRQAVRPGQSKSLAFSSRQRSSNSKSLARSSKDRPPSISYTRDPERLGSELTPECALRLPYAARKTLVSPRKRSPLGNLWAHFSEKINGGWNL